MQSHPPTGITRTQGQAYRDDDPDAVFDPYYPIPNFALIAKHGYTVIGVNYSLGPGRSYPTAAQQLNDALAYITTHATRLPVDPGKIFRAGDSVGAQLAAQLSTLTTSPDYAEEVGIGPALATSHLRGVVLNCGIYDVATLLVAPGLLGWGDRGTPTGLHQRRKRRRSDQGSVCTVRLSSPRARRRCDHTLLA